ncbi:MAG: chromosome segregation protein SMC [Candidatus Altiarchaeota archaeon]
MRLTKLELKGFKSFRDKTTLEFPDKFMGIVGPNGSGKSNITEAICFVLGKSRGLRAANLQELIFNGGISGKASDKAVVSLTLKDNEGRRHKIARMVDREGHSVYKLNDSRVTRGRIIDLIGDNEYNIILQDDVTKVIDMKPKERRTIIDDLCGIAEYDEKRDKSLNELKKVEERISETHIILGEKQGYMKELEKERNEALKYKDTREILNQCKASLLYKEIQSLNRRLERIDGETSGMKAEREDGLRRIGESKTGISEKNRRLKEISEQLVRMEEDRSGNKITETRGEINRRQDRKSLLEERLESIASELKERKERKKSLDVGIRECSASISELSSKAGKLLDDIKREEESMGDGLVLTEVDEARNKVFDYRSRLQTFSELKDRASAELAELVDERKDFESRLGEYSTLEQGMVKELEKKQREYDKLSGDRKKYEEEYSRINDSMDCLRYKMEASRIKLSEKDSELKTIERTSGGLRGAVKAVMGLKKVLPGIHGSVSQLGTVSDSKYQLPMQVAAGGRMQYVVVDTVETAAKCIDYLRKKQVGRATFLPLDKLKPRTADKPPSKSLGFARDFMNCDKKYNKVFDYIFADTVLVKDINAARTVGVGEWRMVTLDGDLLELSGAMTGGFIKDRPEVSFSNIEEIEKEIESLKKQIVSLEDEYEETRISADKMKSLMEKQSGMVSKAKEELDQSRLTAQSNTEKKNVIQERLRQLSGKISSIKTAISDNELKSTELKKTLSLSEKELGRIVEERGTIDRTMYDKLKDEYSELKVEESRMSEKLNSFNSQSEENDREITGLSASHDTVSQEIGALSSEIRGYEERLEELMKKSSLIGGEIDAIIQERSTIEEEIVQFGEAIGETERRLEVINAQLNDYVIEKTRIDTRLEDLNREYGKYEGVEVLDKSIKDLEDLAEKMQQELLGFGSVNMRAIETYDVVRTEFEEISGKLQTLRDERQSIFDFMEKIEAKKKATFMEAFDKVKENFERIFADLSEGKGTLVLDNPMVVSESGLIIKASPGGKRVMSLDAMSGGEKVLTSAAFLLAVQQYKPSYFYVVDELDAALDKRNSIRLADMLHSSNSQFLMVTHNNSMLRYMDSALGVSMQDGVSHIVGVRFSSENQALVETPIPQEPDTPEEAS